MNADPLAQIIGTETIADVITGDAKACALLDSGATTDLMSLAYAQAQSFDMKLIMDLSDHFMNIHWQQDLGPLRRVMWSTTFTSLGSHHMILIELH